MGSREIPLKFCVPNLKFVGVTRFSTVFIPDGFCSRNSDDLRLIQ